MIEGGGGEEWTIITVLIDVSAFVHVNQKTSFMKIVHNFMVTIIIWVIFLLLYCLLLDLHYSSSRRVGVETSCIYINYMGVYQESQEQTIKKPLLLKKIKIDRVALLCYRLSKEVYFKCKIFYVRYGLQWNFYSPAKKLLYLIIPGN